VFQGAGFDALAQAMRQAFDKVAVRKPDASRDRSPKPICSHGESAVFRSLGTRPVRV
jgi:23S rRNA U2552 (ribose-2'-O)-methylase RlmE/FtsJ